MPIQHFEKIMRVALYIRVSTKLQEDRYSLSAQTHELTQYARSQGWEIVATFKDVDSGGKLHKEGLDALLDCVEDRKVDIVLVVDQDRLSRLDTVAWEYLKDVLRDNSVKIAEPGRIVDLTNDDDEFFSDLKNIISRREKKSIVRRMMRGKRQFTREGKVWGKQPDEYNYDSATGELSINDANSWVIQYIDDLYLEQGLGASAISRKLNSFCKTPGGSKWSSRQVLNKLKAVCYHGVLEKTFSNGETITIHDVYPKLRSIKTYDRIQHKMRSREGKRDAEPNMLRDVAIRCADCGRIVSVNKGFAYGHGENKHVRYPVWYLRHLSEDVHERCPAKPYINFKRLEVNLYEAAKLSLSKEKDLSSILDIDLDKTDEELKKIERELVGFKKAKNETSESIDRLLKLYLSGKWNEDQLDANRVELDTKLAEIENEICIREKRRELLVDSQINVSTIRGYIRESLNLTEDELITTAYIFNSRAGIDVKEQQRIIGVLFPTATLHKENVLMLHMRYLNGSTIDVRVEIDSMEQTKEFELIEASKQRFVRAQRHLNENPGLSLERLAKELGHQPSTLKSDMVRLGMRLKHLAPNRLSKDITYERLDRIKAVLKEKPKASIRSIEDETGINRKAISKIIKDYNLR